MCHEKLPAGTSLKHWQQATISTALILAMAGLMMPSFAGGKQGRGRLNLSPELSFLLKAEMAELADDLKMILAALAQADWEMLVVTSHRMHESYILKKSITPALIEESS